MSITIEFENLTNATRVGPLQVSTIRIDHDNFAFSDYLRPTTSGVLEVKVVAEQRELPLIENLMWVNVTGNYEILRHKITVRHGENTNVFLNSWVRSFSCFPSYNHQWEIDLSFRWSDSQTNLVLPFELTNPAAPSPWVEGDWDGWDDEDVEEETKVNWLAYGF